MADDDDFGFSSGDEADMLTVESTHAVNRKRKYSDSRAKDAKRSRGETENGQAVALAKEILTKRFGMDAFRFKQEAVIARLLVGDSAVVVFPTGGGKSLCYQVPALCFDELDRESARPAGGSGSGSGITLVVSPLLALMKDQVDALRRRGVKAASMDSTKSREEYLETVDAMRNGALDILYCAPERLNNEGFISSMAHVKGGVRLLAVDEAHCISEWGHAFRPDYLKVARFAREIRAERVVCLTATATPKVAKDVCQAFDIPEAGLFRTTTYRPNLHLHAESYQTKADSYPKLRAFIKAHPGPTIVYVTTQRDTDELANQLRNHGFNTQSFHAGMKTEDKLRIQDEFMASDDLIIVATIAFGMGIDKANIRNVIHYDIPRSLEGYSQEIGRAGRDGLDSHCMLYVCAEDLHIKESYARSDLPSQSSVNNLLREVFSYQPTDAPESHIEANFYQLSKQYDIKATTLGSIFAQLELRFGIMRATTPKYTKYQYKARMNTDWDKSPAANAIRNAADKKSTWTYVDVDMASKRSGIGRMDLVSKLNHWNDGRYIELTTGGVVNLFRLQKAWPLPIGDRDRIATALYKELEVREQQDLQRIQDVMDLITDDTCLARSLAKHFGDDLPNNAVECGHCTWCETHKAVPKVEPFHREWDSKAFHKILETVPDRDDPRYLARIAFGIASPRSTSARLSSDPVLGSMCDHDFMTLLNAFTKICEQAPAEWAATASKAFNGHGTTADSQSKSRRLYSGNNSSKNPSRGRR